MYGICRRSLLGAAAAALFATAVVQQPVVRAAPVQTPDKHWVGAWMAPPTDNVNGVDGSFRPILNVSDQTFRVIVTPHLSGQMIRIRLSNTGRQTPLRIGDATAGVAGTGASIRSKLAELTFGGRPAVTIPAYGEVLSDPVELGVKAWQRLAVSVSVPGSTQFISQHAVANATSYYTPPGAGDRSSSRNPADFPLATTVAPIVSRVDVVAPRSTSAIVALGDSITDGFVAGNYLGVPQSATGVIDQDVRYPDFLQRRIDVVGAPRSVINAGISGNRITADGLIPQYGVSVLKRLDRDVVSVPGVRDVIFLEGINDLGVPVGASADAIVAGYRRVINVLHVHGIRVHLGTILPASDALLDGITAPFSDATRRVVNRWIRRQHLSDSVVDFDRALAATNDSSVLARRYAGPDRLHPNPAGYRKMAQAVDLSAIVHREN